MSQLTVTCHDGCKKLLTEGSNAVGQDRSVSSRTSFAKQSNAIRCIYLWLSEARPDIMEVRNFKFFNAIPHYTKRRVLK